MPRTGLLIGLAAILIAAAVGVLVWTNFLRGPVPAVSNQQTGQLTAPAAPKEQPNWMHIMNDVAANGGMALTFDDSSIKRWGIAPQHKLERFSIDGSGAVLARLTSSVPLVGETVPWNEKGLSFPLPLGMAVKTNGKKIEVGIIARQSPSNGSNHLNIVYATQQAGNSGWQKFKLTGEFALYKMQYDVPAVADGYSTTPIVVVHADDTGSGRAVEIIGLYIKVLS
jgi:hypothetical protein